MMMRFVWMTLVVGLASCHLETECTLVEYRDGLFVAFVRPSGEPMPAGTYAATIRAENEQTSFTWQRPGSAPFGVMSLSDGHTLRAESAAAPAISDGLRFVVRDRGAHEDGGPEDLHITLTIDGATVADASFTPTYARDEPNGDFCGVWTHAEVALTVVIPRTARRWR